MFWWGLTIGLVVVILVLFACLVMVIKVTNRCADRLLARTAGEYVVLRREEERRTQAGEERTEEVPAREEPELDLIEAAIPADLAERVQAGAGRYL